MKENSDFELLLDEFGEFAMETADPPLGKRTVSSYRTWIHDVAEGIDNELGDGWFEKFVFSYSRGDDVGGYGRCCIFIDGQLRQAQGKDRKNWQNRYSAFKKLANFLECRNENAELAAPGEREAMPEPEIPAEPLPVPESVAEELPPDPDAVVETLRKSDLMNKFLSRLKTQSRWYPAIGEHGVLFPARLLNRIFSWNDDKRWGELLRADLGRMGIRIGTGDGDICLLGDVTGMDLLADGRFKVTVAGGAHAMHTRTCRRGVVVERSRRGWAGISIDHLVPMENDIRAHADAMPAFRRLTRLVCSFLKERGEKYNLRYDEGWFRQVYAANRQELDGMRDDLYAELCRLDRRYELMDTRENGKRSNRA